MVFSSRRNLVAKGQSVNRKVDLSQRWNHVCGEFLNLYLSMFYSIGVS